MVTSVARLLWLEQLPGLRRQRDEGQVTPATRHLWPATGMGCVVADQRARYGGSTATREMIIFSRVAGTGNLGLLQFLYARAAPGHEKAGLLTIGACMAAAQAGSLEVLEWLRMEGCRLDAELLNQVCIAAVRTCHASVQAASPGRRPRDMELNKDEADGQGAGGVDRHTGRTYIALTHEAIVGFIKSQPARQSPAGTRELTVKQLLDHFEPAVQKDNMFKTKLKMLMKSGTGSPSPPHTHTHTHTAPPDCARACERIVRGPGAELLLLRLEGGWWCRRDRGSGRRSDRPVLPWLQATGPVV